MSEDLPAAPARQVLLQRIYLKDASVEVPLAPQVFTRQWNPQLDVQVGTTTTLRLGERPAPGDADRHRHRQAGRGNRISGGSSPGRHFPGNRLRQRGRDPVDSRRLLPRRDLPLRPRSGSGPGPARRLPAGAAACSRSNFEAVYAEHLAQLARSRRGQASNAVTGCPVRRTARGRAQADHGYRCRSAPARRWRPSVVAVAVAPAFLWGRDATAKMSDLAGYRARTRAICGKLRLSGAAHRHRQSGRRRCATSARTICWFHARQVRRCARSKPGPRLKPLARGPSQRHRLRQQGAWSREAAASSGVHEVIADVLGTAHAARHHLRAT